MNHKDWGYYFVISGLIIFLSGICYNFLTFIIIELLSYSFFSPIIICVGIVLVAIGGLTKEKKSVNLGI